MANVLYIPMSPPINLETGDWKPEWRQWIQSPTFLSIDTGSALGVTSGGTGLTTAPANGQFLVGNLTGTYSLTSTIPASALPAFTGDVTKPAGISVLTLATVNPNVGLVGSSSSVPAIVVNAKGLITAAADTPITGAFQMTVVAGFGCNSKAAQTSAAVNSAIAGTAGVVYTATEQGLINSLLALVNQLRSALVNNGIAV